MIPEGASGTLRVISEQVKKMTPAEFRKSLMAAGILGTNGKLTANYASVKKKRSS
jgi:hypothetical protein